MEPVVSNVERALLRQLENPESALVKRVTEVNRILLHNFQVETPRLCGCGLLGCEREFEVILIPHQALYPKFCPEHRTEHRRRLFVERFMQRASSDMRPVQVLAVPPHINGHLAAT